jgi:hypothetical protein
MWWFVLIFVVLLKIPMLYLGWVIWWAIKDPPGPDEGYEGAGDALDADGPQSDGWWKRKLPARTPRRGPHGSPARRPRTAFARARAKQVQ